MAYSEIGIVNTALGRVGASSIASFSENSTNAIYANSVYEYIRDEVLQAETWAFARVRYKLSKSTSTPEYGRYYAYPLPTDYLKLDDDDKDDPVIYPIKTTNYPYKIEIVNNSLCLTTDYDNTNSDIYIRYIKKEVDPGKWSATFVSALIYRFAQEFAIKLASSRDLYDFNQAKYEQTLKQAKGVNRSGDYIENELGSTDWELAGR
jgi:hypothetical protein